MSDENKNKNKTEGEVVYCRYKTINGRKIYPKKAKAFKMIIRKRPA